MTENHATYSPEDNKLRLYVGRVPRDEYLKLRADGWTSTPKQACDFVATWTPSRRDTCLEYAEIIEDEDMSPEERAADRAERFGGYRDKRLGEATGQADRFEAGPSAHGFQNQDRAERSAARHDRIAGRACDSWSKAEYWQQRTAGVIRHALHKSSPGVRMGRIKEIEAALRKVEADIDSHNRRVKAWRHIAGIEDQEKQTEQARRLIGAVSFYFCDYPSPKDGKEASLDTLLSRGDITGKEAAALYLSNHQEYTIEESEWGCHLRLRLAYENQMLEAQGGRAAFVEMVPGGWIGNHQIRKVNKSPVTGRVVSVEIMSTRRAFTKESGYRTEETRPCPAILNVEQFSKEVYRPPTPEDLETLKATRAAEKAAAPKKTECPLINPTEEEAEKLQALWNARAKAAYDEKYDSKYYDPFKAAEVCKIPQAIYSQNSKGAYARAETLGLCVNGILEPAFSNLWTSEGEKRAKERGPALCKIRVTSGNSSQWPYVKRVIVLTDKPGKPFPAAVWEARQVSSETLVDA